MQRKSASHIANTLLYVDAEPFRRRPTAIHPARCPLFRLPAELRTRIWIYAYGDGTINVSLKVSNKNVKDSQKKLVYTHPDQHRQSHFKLPPLVCRQFYSETTAAFYATTAVVFHEPHAFRVFALSQHPLVERLRCLSIPRFDSTWNIVLSASLIGRLKSLRGARLAYVYFRRFEAWPRASSPELRGLWRIIRAFQQHELEARHTSLEVTAYNVYKTMHDSSINHPGVEYYRLRPGQSGYDNVVLLQKELTEGLLRYNPRRLSKRAAM